MERDMAVCGRCNRPSRRRDGWCSASCQRLASKPPSLVPPRGEWWTAPSVNEGMERWELGVVPHVGDLRDLYVRLGAIQPEPLSETA
jgi:hypothetical protein